MPFAPRVARSFSAMRPEFALYVQDQWTMRRMTLNLGVRYDVYDMTIPASHLGPGVNVPARDFPEVKHSPRWENFSPRLGTAYDVLCTQGQDGSISWKVIVDKTAKTAATSRLSSDAKKIVSLSANDHGLAAQANAIRSYVAPLAAPPHGKPKRGWAAAVDQVSVHATRCAPFSSPVSSRNSFSSATVRLGDKATRRA